MEISMLPEIKKILYATDLSENARYAARYAVALAERFNAEITTMHRPNSGDGGPPARVNGLISPSPAPESIAQPGAGRRRPPF
jgi:nucleotide-binding universal stress UspA family protein